MSFIVKTEDGRYYEYQCTVVRYWKLGEPSPYKPEDYRWVDVTDEYSR